MKADQSSGIELCAEDVFNSTYLWLKERGCEELVNTQLIEQYAMSVYILFHTGMRISEFCGLTIKDIDFENNTINIDHQLHRYGDMTMAIQKTKTAAGKRVIPMSPEVRECFRKIIENRPRYKEEPIIDGYTGFL